MRHVLQNAPLTEISPFRRPFITTQISQLDLISSSLRQLEVSCVFPVPERIHAGRISPILYVFNYLTLRISFSWAAIFSCGILRTRDLTATGIRRS